MHEHIESTLLKCSYNHVKQTCIFEPTYKLQSSTNFTLLSLNKAIDKYFKTNQYIEAISAYLQ